MAAPLRTWGAGRGAGKSLPATTRGRRAVRQPLDVAPIKTQNMSHNPRVERFDAPADPVDEHPGAAALRPLP